MSRTTGIPIPRAPRASQRSAVPDAIVVLNPAAPGNRGGAARRALERAFADRGTSASILETSAAESRGAELERAVRDAILGGCPRVIAAGGDGTVALAATCLLAASGPDARAALGIVPAGTTNALARELGIPLGLEEAARLASFGEDTLALDVMMAADRPILTQLGIGPDAQMIRDTSRRRQVQLGRLAYLMSLWRRRRQPMRSFVIEVDGRQHRMRAWEVLVANAGVAGTPPFTWGPGIDPTDGVLDVAVFDVRQASDYGTVLWRLVTGSHRRDANTKFFQARREVTIRANTPVLVQGDGEVLGTTPVTVRVARAAIRVVVPRDIEDVEGIVGSPDDPPGAGGPTAAEVAPAPGEGETTIGEDVDAMLAEHSRTWVLQGALRHPLSAVAALDAAVFLRINRLVLGSAVDGALVLLSRFMHLGEGWALVALVLCLADFSTGWRAAVTALPCLWLTMLAVNYPLKDVFRRRRPFLAFVDARVLGPRPLDTSLPSGHTAAAFAGALLFGAYTPAWSPVYYLLASVVGFSRIYLGVHYPSDVVLGAVVGTVLAAACRALLHAAAPGLR